MMWLSSPLEATSKSVSSWDELYHAVQEGHKDIQLTSAVFSVPSFSSSDKLGMIILDSPYSIDGESKEKSLFKGKGVNPANNTNRAFVINTEELVYIANCSFINFFAINSVSVTAPSGEGSVFRYEKGGAYLQSVDFKNNGILITHMINDVRIQNGVIHLLDKEFASKFYQCHFTDNYIITESGSSSSASSSLFQAYKGRESEGAILNCVFERNYAKATASNGSATADSGALEFDGLIAHSIFRGNNAQAYSASNQANALGGALISHHGYVENPEIVDCLFEHNYVQAQDFTDSGISSSLGGAIYGVIGLQDCQFYSNYTMVSDHSYGGAVYVQGSYGNGQGCLLFVSAIEKDSIFRGNRMNVSHVDSSTGKPLNGTANAIYTMPDEKRLNNGKIETWTSNHSIIELRAKGDKTLAFYDPIILQMGMEIQTTHDGSLATQRLGINRSDESGDYTGRVVFSGEDFADTSDPENWTSRLYYNMEVSLHGGEFVIRDKAIFGAAVQLPDDYYIPEGIDYDGEIGAKSFILEKGTLELTNNGHLMVRHVFFEGGHEQSILRTGSGAQITAQTVDYSKGVSFDLSPYLDNKCSGLSISAQSVTLGGKVGLHDSWDFYTHKRWDSKQEFLALALSPEAARSLGRADFEELLSLTSGSAVVDSPYTYKGTWEKKWVDSDQDGVSDSLYVVWVPKEGGDNGITEVEPELRGDSVANSMLSVASSMQVVGDLCLGQIGLSRYKVQQAMNYWASAVGDFDMHRTDKGRDGYDYNGFGYALGADYCFNYPDTWLVGMGFGNMYGENKSRGFVSETKQESFIGIIYGGFMKEYDWKNALNITGAISFGMTDNAMNTFFRDGERSQGDWDSDSLRIEIKGEWIFTLDKTWSWMPFIGLEYDNVDQSVHTETGAKVRRFGQGVFSNLALPIGVGVLRKDHANSAGLWLNSAELSYVPDVHCKNSSASVERLDNGFTWTARGVDSSRHALRFTYSTRLVWDKTWSSFAGYELDLRMNAVYQQMNLGMSASF